MADLSPLPRQTGSNAVARNGFSETIRKVDHAVSRLEELQNLARGGHIRNPGCPKQSVPNREKIALHVSNAPKAPQRRDHRNGQRPSPVTKSSNPYTGTPSPQQARDRKPSLPIGASRRSVKATVRPPPSLCSKIHASPHVEITSRGRIAAGIPSPRLDAFNSSPPSSACSSTVPMISKRIVQPVKEIVPLRPPRAFFVNTGSANPNRPWCLSASPSHTTSSSTSTSNYVYTPSSDSSGAVPIKSPSRFSPLYRQNNRSRMIHETHPSQPLLCKNTENIDAPSDSPQKVHRFSQNRLSLAPKTKKAFRRFSLAANGYHDSPPKPLPALITRLPKRRKTPFSPDEKGGRKTTATSKSTPIASPQKLRTTSGRGTSKATGNAMQQQRKQQQEKLTSPILSNLPLPPALQVQGNTTNRCPSAVCSASRRKVLHRRSSSCLLLFTGGSLNTLSPSRSSSERSAQKVMKEGCLDRDNKENCFRGCSPIVWPCLRKSWSSGQRPTSENPIEPGIFLE
ncbi:hypothetical protein KP509_05G067500 [Ceratopteris richardii]|uniref:Uncharacterized protein n=1 Tax=Ceratopteris richardii TaxID=49495 RepID=A0A8T2UMJ1_CERRI|nr:hypothetical protein KP509_05G067500 [Ceratopteris richardii]